jgi:23S rRNA pseudouridine1911/1915/1917 synthase
LVNGLLQRYPSIIEVGDDSVRPGIVHRLDKDTTGVMVVALTERAFGFLKKEFMNHRVKKRYINTHALRAQRSMNVGADYYPPFEQGK